MTEEQYVEIYFDEITHETDEAYLFRVDEDEEVWLPKSQVEITESDIVEMPEWLAIEKGLI